MNLANHTGNLRGLVAMFVAVAAFSFMDALLKLFAAHYPPMQVTVLRAAASLPFVLLPCSGKAVWLNCGSIATACT